MAKKGSLRKEKYKGQRKGDSQLVSIDFGASIFLLCIYLASVTDMSERKRMRLGRKVLRENRGCTGGLSRISRWKWNFQHDRVTGSIKDRITSCERAITIFFSLTYKKYLCRTKRENVYTIYHYKNKNFQWRDAYFSQWYPCAVELRSKNAFDDYFIRKMSLDVSFVKMFCLFTHYLYRILNV